MKVSKPTSNSTIHPFKMKTTFILSQSSPVLKADNRAIYSIITTL
ncbi:hypothetical protein LSAJ18_120165 [Latilactobacillus sakei]|nr:hypothetical protein LSAJ18_120165 [Latilactobacillus sakei]SOB37804.1 hypothetical protein LSAJ160_140041 [Latilactobacillus sakei]